MAVTFRGDCFPFGKARPPPMRSRPLRTSLMMHVSGQAPGNKSGPSRATRPQCQYLEDTFVDRFDSAAPSSRPSA